MAWTHARSPDLRKTYLLKNVLILKYFNIFSNSMSHSEPFVPLLMNLNRSCDIYIHNICKAIGSGLVMEWTDIFLDKHLYIMYNWVHNTEAVNIYLVGLIAEGESIGTTTTPSTAVSTTPLRHRSFRGVIFWQPSRQLCCCPSGEVISCRCLLDLIPPVGSGAAFFPP